MLIFADGKTDRPTDGRSERRLKVQCIYIITNTPRKGFNKLKIYFFTSSLDRVIFLYLSGVV